VFFNAVQRIFIAVNDQTESGFIVLRNGFEHGITANDIHFRVREIFHCFVHSRKFVGADVVCGKRENLAGGITAWALKIIL